VSVSPARARAERLGPTSPNAPPPVVFEGGHWSTQQLTGMAAVWYRMLGEKLAPAAGPLAMVMLNDPESIALFFALSCFEAPLVVLPLDAKPWHSAPPLPRDTHLVLSPSLGYLETEARQLGLAVTVLEAPEVSSAARDQPPFMRTQGLVLFTSGSTGVSRPVCRSTTAVIGGVRGLLAAFGASPGAGVIATLPLGRALGFCHGLAAATVLESPLALLARFDHTAVLGLFASQAYQYWAGTPMMADVLSRCPGPEQHPAPRVCDASGRVSTDLARRFKARFGVPLRQHYGTTEAGTVSADDASSDDVHSEAAGRPLPAVDVRIGDDPRRPFPAGALGRVWISSPYMMGGYGFPPDLAAPETVDRWWGTPDVGTIDEVGRLIVSGRLDDCFRTEAGYLVNPAAVATALETYPGVGEVLVATLRSASGPVIGVLVESAGPLDATELRAHLWRSLPRWSQPRVVETTDALPRLASGRADRRACVARLEQGLGPSSADRR
jgi:long-chain acyl-CoA synthetase